MRNFDSVECRLFVAVVSTCRSLSEIIDDCQLVYTHLCERLGRKYRKCDL